MLRCNTVNTTWVPGSSLNGNGSQQCWPGASGTYYWRVIGHDDFSNGRPQTEPANAEIRQLHVRARVPDAALTDRQRPRHGPDPDLDSGGHRGPLPRDRLAGQWRLVHRHHGVDVVHARVPAHPWLLHVAGADGEPGRPLRDVLRLQQRRVRRRPDASRVRRHSDTAQRSRVAPVPHPALDGRHRRRELRGLGQADRERRVLTARRRLPVPGGRVRRRYLPRPGRLRLVRQGPQQLRRDHLHQRLRARHLHHQPAGIIPDDQQYAALAGTLLPDDPEDADSDADADECRTQILNVTNQSVCDNLRNTPVLRWAEKPNVGLLPALRRQGQGDDEPCLRHQQRRHLQSHRREPADVDPAERRCPTARPARRTTTRSCRARTTGARRSPTPSTLRPAQPPGSAQPGPADARGRLGPGRVPDVDPDPAPAATGARTTSPCRGRTTAPPRSRPTPATSCPALVAPKRAATWCRRRPTRASTSSSSRSRSTRRPSPRSGRPTRRHRLLARSRGRRVRQHPGVERDRGLRQEVARARARDPRRTRTSAATCTSPGPSLPFAASTARGLQEPRHCRERRQPGVPRCDRRLESRVPDQPVGPLRRRPGRGALRVARPSHRRRRPHRRVEQLGRFTVVEPTANLTAPPDVPLSRRPTRCSPGRPRPAPRATASSGAWSTR